MIRIRKMELEVVLIVLCVLVVITNMAVICMVVFIKELRTFTNYFVLSLAVSDVLVGGIMLPLNHPWVPSSEVTGHVIMITMLSGVGNICAVTWDRYVAVMEPFTYRTKLKRYYKKILIILWITAITCSLIPLAWKDEDTSIYHKVYYVMTILGFVILPYLAIIIGYVRIYARLRYHTAQLKSEGITRSKREGAQRASLEGKTVKVFVVVVVLFLLSWVPVIYMTMVDGVFQQPNLVPSLLQRFNLLVLAVSSLVNPLLYGFMKRDFNGQIKRCLCCLKTTPAVHALAMETTPVRACAENSAFN
ncbi:histamine H2 receptor-like [Actinia tenebrosa]|uniref:Histamine H2 receptor-like n=1 Tax=Actinia tenebrosa TaxID=6105 RepID=A0A6P8HRC9_ACTTE|nr:histamine H2 receptor-like [Actinia tenebrosa]